MTGWNRDLTQAWEAVRKGSDRALAVFKNLVSISKNNELLTLVKGHFISVHTTSTVAAEKNN